MFNKMNLLLFLLKRAEKCTKSYIRNQYKDNVLLSDFTANNVQWRAIIHKLHIQGENIRCIAEEIEAI